MEELELQIMIEGMCAKCARVIPSGSNKGKCSVPGINTDGQEVRALLHICTNAGLKEGEGGIIYEAERILWRGRWTTIRKLPSVVR